MVGSCKRGRGALMMMLGRLVEGCGFLDSWMDSWMDEWIFVGAQWNDLIVQEIGSLLRISSSIYLQSRFDLID